MMEERVGNMGFGMRSAHFVYEWWAAQCSRKTQTIESWSHLMLRESVVLKRAISLALQSRVVRTT